MHVSLGGVAVYVTWQDETRKLMLGHHSLRLILSMYKFCNHNVHSGADSSGVEMAGDLIYHTIHKMPRFRLQQKPNPLKNQTTYLNWLTSKKCRCDKYDKKILIRPNCWVWFTAYNVHKQKCTKSVYCKLCNLYMGWTRYLNVIELWHKYSLRTFSFPLGCQQGWGSSSKGPVCIYSLTNNNIKYQTQNNNYFRTYIFSQITLRHLHEFVCLQKKFAAHFSVKYFKCQQNVSILLKKVQQTIFLHNKKKTVKFLNKKVCRHSCGENLWQRQIMYSQRHSRNSHT